MTEHLRWAALVWSDTRSMLVEASRLVVAHKWRCLAFLVMLVLIALLIIPYDKAWLAWLNARATPAKDAWAEGLSFWGDYYTGTLIVFGALLGAGLFRGSERLRRAALACLLAASLAGLFVNVFRGTLGRPRPLAKLEDGLYGPSLDFKYQGSPSAHAATSFGTATAALVTLPALGVPLMVAATAVVWSRMSLQHHHPADVTVGALLGGAFGLIFGVAARRRPASIT